jgi:diacylglycerol kinase family enzyme
VRVLSALVAAQGSSEMAPAETGSRGHQGPAGRAALGGAGRPPLPSMPLINPATRDLSRYGWRPMDPPHRPVLLINPRSGDGAAERAGLAGKAADKGIEVIVLTPGDSLAELAGAAVTSGADALGMAGGDGSLAVVAAVAVAQRLPFVCVPAGTRNHFALDLGVSRRDLTGALDAFTDGVERWIDVAEVNGRMFLNNVSLGIYGEAVRKAAYRDAKVRTLAETAGQVLGPSGQAPALRVVDDAGGEHRHPAVVLVSNNPYALESPLARGTRPALDTGQLGIVVLDVPDESPHPPAHAWSTPLLQVDAPVPVHAGIDGEPVELSPPLRFTSRPAALRVRISSRHPGASPSALFPPATPPRQLRGMP